MNWILKVQIGVRRLMQDETGALGNIIGWIGVAALSVVIVLGVYNALNNDTSISQLLIDKVKTFINKFNP